ncbi:hypothetical protein BaRGS_00000581 [Batillaria attramentaria]|uniref:Uncharacterized protein n=1 Tax=Batillaria attramentaria TaxID=370345 RepID=A0ABD0M9U6_9CAEN
MYTTQEEKQMQNSRSSSSAKLRAGRRPKPLGQLIIRQTSLLLGPLQCSTLGEKQESSLEVKMIRTTKNAWLRRVGGGCRD